MKDYSDLARIFGVNITLSCFMLSRYDIQFIISREKWKLKIKNNCCNWYRTILCVGMHGLRQWWRVRRGGKVEIFPSNMRKIDIFYITFGLTSQKKKKKMKKGWQNFNNFRISPPKMGLRSHFSVWRYSKKMYDSNVSKIDYFNIIINVTTTWKLCSISIKKFNRTDIRIM